MTVVVLTWFVVVGANRLAYSVHMTQYEFEAGLRKLLMPKDGDRDYERKETEAARLIEMLVWDATEKGGGKWDEVVGQDCFDQFIWLHKQP